MQHGSTETEEKSPKLPSASTTKENETPKLPSTNETGRKETPELLSATETRGKKTPKLKASVSRSGPCVEVDTRYVCTDVLVAYVLVLTLYKPMIHIHIVSALSPCLLLL